MKQALRSFLSRNPKRRIRQEGLSLAAVVVPLFEKERELHLLFTRRSLSVRDHQQEISFPGGVFDKEDGSLERTALRELDEELGVGREAVELLGELDDESTFATNYRITPFLGWLKGPLTLRVNPHEIEQILEIPVTRLESPDEVRQIPQGPGLPPLRVPFYRVDGHEIWGATGRILEKVIHLLGGVINLTRPCPK